MTAATLTRPADVGLMAPGHDPRPCVNKPPQWWDLGNEHNPRAIRYCRNVCPLRKECVSGITEETKPKAQIRGGHPYNEYGKKLTVCPNCDTPRTRVGTYGPPTCGCPRRADEISQRREERQAEREAKLAAMLAERKARLEAKGPTGRELIDLWVPFSCAGLTVKEVAARIGVPYGTLKNALHRARAAGDRRVPHFHRPHRKRVPA